MIVVRHCPGSRRGSRRGFDELSIIVAPVVLGGGKRLFDRFTRSLDLEHIGVRRSRLQRSSTIA